MLVVILVVVMVGEIDDNVGGDEDSGASTDADDNVNDDERTKKNKAYNGEYQNHKPAVHPASLRGHVKQSLTAVLVINQRSGQCLVIARGCVRGRGPRCSVIRKPNKRGKE
ncbi:hypothetical protein ElyMa_002986500 [Elysia marginata]|uniref:Secreted protein n=1 Tax=Elysia marginata TaxID=1093978 RepID=A0AAV4IA66_9GAST|nr:hypothetical protein ElyMa_002986500 [Elysia marginata]